MHSSPQKAFTTIVADEMPLICEGLAALCESVPGCTVLGHASDGESVWNMLIRLSPDIALLDLQLPRLMTMELLRRARLANFPTKFIVIANRNERKTVIETLRAGAQGFVLKSGTTRHLEEAFAQVLEGSVYVSPMVELNRIIREQTHSKEDPLTSLSSREHQVFAMLVEGVRAKEIAARLSLSPKTVDTYRASLMRKLDIHDVPGLVKFAIIHKVVQVGA